MAKVRKKPVSDEDLEAILASEDAFTLAIRGHQAIDELLNLLISEKLAAPHVLEVKKLGFALKVDIASALGVIGDRGLFIGINRIRNRFAHNRGVRLSKKDMDSVTSGASPETREILLELADEYGVIPLDVLRRVIGLLLVRLQAQITAIRDEKMHWQIVHEMTNELLGPNRERALEKRRTEGILSERAARRVEEERERRQARGEL